MKKKMVVGIALAMGMLSAGAVSAFAAGSCCDDGKCADNQVVQKFNQESAALSSTLKAKNIELREQNSYDGLDVAKTNALEAEIRELKGKIRLIAEKHGLPSCCLN